ncbi:glycosyltransferase family 2 protein, partial [Microcoleus sp. herbarium12]
YFIQLGFLDGKAGYIYARLLSQYEYQINAKLYELSCCGGQLNVAEPEPTLSPPVVRSQETEVKSP